MTDSNSTTLSAARHRYFTTDHHSVQGILIALTIIGSWTASLILLLRLDLTQLSLVWLLPAIGLQTFLYSGLFITAHDAMHGSLVPQHRGVNHAIGSLMVFLYASFSYQTLLKNHWLHHRYPASDRDPDFHDGQHKNLFSWYFHFVRQYFSWKQLVILSLSFSILHYIFWVSQANMLLFWVLPSLLSSVQLFYFGTFLPHRESEAGYTSAHRARSHALSPLWSFLTCYHFGYHEEHHESPQTPWWQLPVIRRQRIKQKAQAEGIVQ
jgi:beta-carotene ketolase (CrtW type)